MRSIIRRTRSVYRTFQSYQRFTESPHERVVSLLASMLTDRTLPNVVLGAAVTSTLQNAVGSVSATFTVLTWCAWLASVLVYAVGNEVVYAIKAAQEENRIDDEDRRAYQ